jgi:hypothetical protein
MSSVIRMMMRLSQRESRATQNQINRLVRAAAGSAYPTADAVRPLPIPRPQQNINISVYVPRRLAR